MAPVGNNTKKQIITIAQFQEKDKKPLKANSLKTRKHKTQNKRTKEKRMNRPY